MIDRPRRLGMTLLEMIVVVATIAVLLGLLMPSLAGIVAAGRSTQCSANLRQLAIAAQSYSAVYDVFPVALRYEYRDGQFVQVAWDWVTTMDGQLIDTGPLWSFTVNPGKVQQCPEYDGSTNFAGDPFTGYNYNTSYVGGEAFFPNTSWDAVHWGVKPHASDRSSQAAMFGDGAYASGANKFMRAPLGHEGLDMYTIYAGGQAFRHRRSTIVAYVDGHVGSVVQPKKGLNATDDLLEQVMGYPDNGFLSDDDSAYDPR